MLIGGSVVGTGSVGAYTLSDISAIPKPLSRFDWRIQIFHSSGGLKKDFWIEQENNELISLSFERTLKGPVAGSITFAFYDFPVDPDDYIIVFYKDETIYRGIFDSQPDPKGGPIKINPFSIRFKELLYNKPFISKTIKEILQTVITDLESDTGIGWSDSLIEITDTTTYSFDYQYETANSVIDGLVKQIDNVYWGVNADNSFYVKTLSSNVDHLFLQNNQPDFTDIKVKRDYTKVKATRYRVLRKDSTSGKAQTKDAGGVGYDSGAYVPGSNWPTLAIEKLVRKRELKLTVSEVIDNDPDAKDFAYQKLLAEAVVPLTIEIDGINIDNKNINPFDLIKAEDYTEKRLNVIETCDSLTGWSGVTLDTDDFVEGTGSVKYTSTTSSVQSFGFDFGSIYRGFKVLKFGVSYKSTKAGEYLSLSTGATGGDGVGSDGVGPDGFGEDSMLNTFFPLPLSNSNQWFYQDIDYPGDFQYILFKTDGLTTSGVEINVDRIELFGYFRDIYESNVVKISYNIDSQGENIKATLNQIDLQANNEFFISENRIKALETITKES